MQAVILAGGQGTRLRAALGDLPKALAPIRGRPFLAHQIELLREQGFGDLVLCVGYRHDLIQKQFGDGAAYGVRLVYSVEQSPLGTGGALLQARPLLEATFLVANGDTYFQADFAALTAEHQRSGSAATLALVRVADTGRYGRVTVDAAGYVMRFREKAGRSAGLVNAGIYAVSGVAFDSFPEHYPISLERDVFPRLASLRVLRGVAMTGYHRDIGTPESYAQFQEDMP